MGRPNKTSASAYAIAIALLVVVPALPTAPAAGTLGIEGLARSLNVPVEAVRPPPESVWKVVEDASDAVLRAERTGGTYSLTVRDVPLFGFHATARYGTLTFLLDGAVVERFANVNEPFDLALPAGEHTLAWKWAPASSNAVVELVLDGVKAVRAPVITAALLDLRGCLTPPAELTIVAAFEPASVVARVDGQEVPATFTSLVKDLGVVTRIVVQVPNAPEGNTVHELLVTVTDQAGQAWELARQVIRTVVELTTLTGPHGWAYQLRPTVLIVSPCLPQEVASIRLTVDGIERGLVKGLASYAWTFEQDLPFGELHTWRFDFRLVSGYAIVREGMFREGLDVMEFDLSPGAVMAQSGAPSLFGAPTLPAELPMIEYFGGVTGFLVDSVEGFHARAVYAPLAIVCSSVSTVKACMPYGGEHSEAAIWANEQTLTLTDSNGSRTYPGLGQLAAASRASRLAVPEVPLPPVPAI